MIGRITIFLVMVISVTSFLSANPKVGEWANPLLPRHADPQATLHSDGYYYFTATQPEYDRIELRRAKSIGELAEAEPKFIWRKHESGPMGAHIWAPEIHYIDGKWYIYFAAGDAEAVWNIRMYVLENKSANPMKGKWVEKGKIEANWESFSLDATTFEHRGERYLVWAQAPLSEPGTGLYIAKMDTPWSIKGDQVCISKPDFEWEKRGHNVNEGPAVLQRNGRIFMTYSASATDANYCLGLLTANADADLLDRASWKKSPDPVFESSYETMQFGPGHNSFTTTPDGETDIMLYHARNYEEIDGEPLQNPDRATRAIYVEWDEDGTPHFRLPPADDKVRVAKIDAGTREQLFDTDWKFRRGEIAGGENPALGDSNWRVVDLPHDWSIEDLPTGGGEVPQLGAVSGEWRFKRGDNLVWKNPEFDDEGWEVVTLPNTWEKHSGYADDQAYGWFRRTLEIPAFLEGKDFDLLLGRIDDADEVWLNGLRIGGMGSFPPEYASAWNSERRYRVPADLVKADGTDLLAVRVYDDENDGGIYASGTNGLRIGPFDTALSQNGHFTAHTVGGIGWYRKNFTLEEEGKRVSIRFDGVYMNAEVWVNGHWLGEHPHGYTSFEFDLTEHLNPPGEINVVAVRVRNEGRNSRWYSGSGIYRHVWLKVTEPIHVPTHGVFVSTPEVSKERSEVKVSVEVRNDSSMLEKVKVATFVRDASGDLVYGSASEIEVESGEMVSVDQVTVVPSPKLWSPESPHLYLAEVGLLVGEEIVDVVSVPFGIRTTEFDAARGFLLNGEPTLLKGGCIHHDNGPLGAAAIDRAEVRKIELLKANGFNAIRSSHNPPSSALLDACDVLGMLVIDESFDQWTRSKENNEQDYHRFFDEWCETDIATMVRRDRNHPSVIMWSIGNEIPEQFEAVETQKRLRDAVLSHDTTRPVTQGICTDWGDVFKNWNTMSDPAFTHLDVAGYNYLPQFYEQDHARHSDRVMYGSESFPKDAFDYWKAVEEHSYVIGDFVWTAMDYLGESGLAHSVLSSQPNPFFMPWPWNNAWSGDLDLCGFKKPQSYYRDVLWGRSQIELFVHEPIPEGETEVLSWWGWPKEHKSWNWEGHEGETLQISVYSSCEFVRLKLNGELIGEKPVSDATKLTARFEVPYEAGELKAIGLVNGEVVSETVLKTAGEPRRIKLTADRSNIRADRNDLSYITVEIVDSHGHRVPNAEIQVSFTIDGVGTLAGQASAVPNEPASFRVPQVKTFEGRAIAILQPNGEKGRMILRAEAEGLKPAKLVVKCD